MAKNKVKKTKRRLAFFGTLSLVIIVYFVFNLCFYSYRIAVLKTSKADLESQLSHLVDDEENLKTDIQKLKDPEYIAKFARENYMYSKDGEYIIKLEEKEKEEVVKDEKKDYKYLIFICSSSLLIIILYVIKKSRK
ncbi:MAG: septum formation initiator family protein [Bacilli bacterium]|nr:septum formation initiator family protein [Bacilli bacterium]